MAEKFPVGFARIELRPSPAAIYGMEESGLLIYGRKANRPWRGKLTTPDLTRDEHARLYAALVNAEEKNLRFDFVHPKFELPRAYTRATWPLVADPTLVEVTDLYTIKVAGLAVGMRLRAGDRLSLMNDTLVCYCMLSEDVVVESGASQSIPLVPRLPIGVFEEDDIVRFDRPPVRLAIVPGGYDLAEEQYGLPVTIDVMESLA